MKDKILIGEKMTKKGVFLNYLGLVFFGIIAVVGYNGLISKYLHLNNQLNILIMIFIFIAVLLFLTPIIGSSEIIEFNHNESATSTLRDISNNLLKLLEFLQVNKQSLILL